MSDRAGVSWRKREDDILTNMVCVLHYDPKRIAGELDRSVGAVRSRIRFLGLKAMPRAARRALFKSMINEVMK